MIMTAKLRWEIFKAGLRGFIAGVGGASCVLGVTACLCPLSLIISVPVTVGIALAAASIQAYQQWRDIKEREMLRVNVDFQAQVLSDNQSRLLNITRSIDQKIEQITVANHHAKPQAINLDVPTPLARSAPYSSPKSFRYRVASLFSWNMRQDSVNNREATISQNMRHSQR